MANAGKTEGTPTSSEMHIVRGTVRRADGKAKSDAAVKAYDKDLRSEQLLGETKTDRDGRYEIAYTRKKFKQAEKRAADLIVRVYGPDGAVLAESAIIFNAGKTETVDLVVADMRSEYLRLSETILPLLAGQGVSLTDLTEDETHRDFTFIAGETGEDRRNIELFIRAEKLSIEADALRREPAKTQSKTKKATKQRYVSAEIFYGLIRNNLPTTLKGVLAQRTSTLQRALEASRRDKVINPLSDAEIGTAIKKLRELALNRALQTQDDQNKPALGALLAASALPSSKHRAFADLYLDHDGPIDKFWEKLRANPDFADTAGDLQLTFELWTLTRKHVPLIRELKKLGAHGGLKSLSGLVELDDAGWKKLIESAGFPPDTPGKNDAEKIGNYARALATGVESAVPSAAFAARFSRHGIHGTEAVKHDIDMFFAAHPEFDLRRTHIEKYFADHTLLAGLANRATVMDHLKRMQRVFILAPRFEEVRILLEAGIHSAQQIAFMGRDRFVERFHDRLPGERRDIELFFHRAERQNLDVTLMAHRYNNQRPQLAVLPPPPQEVEGVPNWAALFATQRSYCECEHCRSVYSPAAYLVDLLHFIVDRMNLVTQDGNEGIRASDVLFEAHRRQDILNIQLTCQNTNTPVPYVDLANEILENAIAPGDHDPDWPQTVGTAEELSAVPEHINNSAYTRLANAFYPWNLPWNLPVEEVRLWLKHLGVERHDLMKAFQPAAGELADIDIAAEYLGLIHVDREILNGTFRKPNHAAPDPWELWGLEENDNPVPNPDEPDDTLRVGWFEALQRAGVLMQKSGLSYEQLQDLLDLQFIDKNGVLNINRGASCNLDAHRIEILNRSRLDRCQQFLRLWRKLGWTMRELDSAIVALKPKEPNEDFASADLDDALLQDLSNLQTLRRELDLAMETLLVWWGPIQSYDYTEHSKPGSAKTLSLYKRLFLNKAVFNPEPDSSPFTEDPNQLAGNLSDHYSAVAAALGISVEDLSLLASNSIVLPDEILNLANLSALYRHVTLAKALRLSDENYLSLRRLVPTDPFASTSDALRFVDSVRKLRASPFSIAELSYLLRHDVGLNSALVPDESATAVLLSELQVALEQIVTDATSQEGIDRETVRVRQEGLVQERLAVALGLDKTVVALLLERVLRPRTPGLFAVYFDTPHLNGGEVRRIDARVQFDWGVQSPAEGIPADRFSARWTGKVRPDFSETYTFYVRVDDGCRLWIDNDLLIDQWHDQAAVEHHADIALTAETLHDITLEYYENGVNAVVELSWSSPSTIKQIVPETHLYPQNWELTPALLALMYKVALVINKFDMTAWEAGYLAEHGSDFGGFDFNAFPLEGPVSPAPSFANWEQVSDFLLLREHLPGGLNTLRAVLDVAEREDVLRALSESTGWSREELGFLAEQEGSGLDLLFPVEFRNGRALTRLNRCFELLDRLGVSAEQCSWWSIPSLNIELEEDKTPARAAEAARRAAKSKYATEAWLAIAKPLQDILRERRRDALVAYLTNHAIPGHGPFHDTSELFQHFLIDVEMSSCMMTSRIKQAIGSVQLFTQRCMMNLEPEGYPNPDDEWAAYWEWMKNYRIWEANRKVFLYPENWIEPELRDDKSPFFRDLENELLQNEVTTDTVESAFRNYLQKLDAVARLNIRGMYHETEVGVNILHVFARTPNEPYTYYYRRQIDAKIWSAWERVDLDIQENHLIPVVWNRRLHLFWPIFTEKVREPERNVTEDQQGELPQKDWEIRIAWSEWGNGRWSPRKVSSQRLKSPVGDQDMLPFKALIIGQDLVLRAYHAFDVFAVPIADFQFSDCNEEPLLIEDELTDVSTMLAPINSSLRGMRCAELPPLFSDDKLYVFEADFPPSGFFAGFDLWDAKTDIPLFNATPGDFTLLLPHQAPQFNFRMPFFYQDPSRAFLVKSRVAGVAGAEFMNGGVVQEWNGYSFEVFYHPYVCEFIKRLNRYGIDGLLQRSVELLPSPDDFFYDAYGPQPPVLPPYPMEDVDVESGSYSLYNWELFFHVPLLIADRLSKNQKFEEAQKWFHYIFDPTDRSDERRPQRYWRFRKFYEDAAQPIETLHELLADASEVEEQVEQWRKHPFNPHLLARMRNNAYQMTVVMKYIDNLIAWGDQLFRRETIESINEAALLYVLAAQILGPKPIKLPAQAQEPKSYRQVRDGEFDALSNPEAENLFAFAGFAGAGPQDFLVPGDQMLDGGGQLRPKAQVITTRYFCVPPNDKLLGYWDTVADRLFKIRYCMNIEGVVRRLPLFEAPIEPGLLVRAAAAGVDISTVLTDASLAVPHYRFSVLLQKAVEFCSDVKTLGSALLAAIEKRDAEELARLRSSHEIALLDAMTRVKQGQVNEAEESYQALQKSELLVTGRRDYYRDIVRMSGGENLQISSLDQAFFWNQIELGIHAGVAAAWLIPHFTFGTSGWAGTPVATTEVGGFTFGNVLNAAVKGAELLAARESHTANRAGVLASYDRRWDEWKLQKALANKELDQIRKQIAAASVRKDIAVAELENHGKQVEQARGVDAYMQDKFTNLDLYNWMVGQISGIYFQSYQLASDVAKRAEQAYRHELGLSDSDFIQFGHWDSLKKGLLAGEKLHYDLKRMEMAYLDQNKREYEITKHISLAMLDPIALVMLKETGNCFVNLPEVIFDLDYPSHYMRRIKAVSLTIPCVAGPYSSVNCTLTLLRNSVRRNTAPGSQYVRNTDGDGLAADDDRFADSIGSIQSIATSSAQNDSGVFDLNFRDERYLPFEGAGTISRWSIELPTKFKQFDYNTISDVVLHLRYTARDGGEALKDQAVDALQAAVNTFIRSEGQGLAQIFSLRHEFPTEWYRFLHPTGETGDNSVTLQITADRFPFLFHSRQIAVEVVSIFVKVKPEFVATHNHESIKLTLAAGNSAPTSNNHSEVDLLGMTLSGGLLRANKPFGQSPPVDWTMNAWLDDGDGGGPSRLDPNAVAELVVVCQYTVGSEAT